MLSQLVEAGQSPRKGGGGFISVVNDGEGGEGGEIPSSDQRKG